MAGPDESEHRPEAVSEDHPSRLADDAFYGALASTARRRVLHYLADTDETTVDELATVLSGWAATATGGMATADDRATVANELRHLHLPKLAEAGLIRYDRDAGTVRLASLDPKVTEIVRQSVAARRPDADRE